MSIKLKNIKKLKNTLKISIITVTKNSERFLEENLESLKAQTYKNFEHIIIDGKSSEVMELWKLLKNIQKIFIIGKVKKILVCMMP